jgi:hypothetical protein
MNLQPGTIYHLDAGDEITTPDDAIAESIVCQWPSELPIKTSHWNLVYNHFKQNRQFLSADDVRSIIAAND